MRTVVVTGDSRGLGPEIVETLLETADYDVVGLSRSETARVESARERWPERYTHLEFDLAEPEAIPGLYREALEPRGPLYGLVNNAAWGQFGPLSTATADDLRTLFDVNVVSPMLLSKAILEDMEQNGTAGSLVHVSSIATKRGYEGLSMYGATKGAIEAFSMAIAREWGDRGIRSNCVAPGFMETDMTSALDRDARERIYARSSIGEPTSETSVAAAVAFLLSPAAESITGEVLRVDAGL